MITTAISISCAALVFILIYSFFGAIGAILPALVILIATFFLISRSIAKKLEVSMILLQGELMKGKTDRAIEFLKDLKKRFKSWQFFLGSTIDGQIGTIYYMKGQYQTAKPYLEKAFVKHWVAKAMLAVIYYRERKINKMEEEFANATKHVKKAGLLWSLWAYCVWRNGDIERAIGILSRGKALLGKSDPHLAQNLLSLQNSKRMKMKNYGDQWYQFQLELTPGQTQARQGRVRFKSR